MSEAENLLNDMTSEDVSLYTTNPEIEEHIVIDDNRYIDVPTSLQRIAVQYDHNVETVTFDCPRYWDENDLSEMYIYINYLRSDKIRGRYLAKNIRVDDADENIIHFDWTIGNEISFAKGPVIFLVCAVKTNSEGNEEIHWNSEINKQMVVSDGLECTEYVINEHPDIITDLLTRMDGVVAANTPILDKTLTKEGFAADAKTTRDILNNILESSTSYAKEYSVLYKTTEEEATTFILPEEYNEQCIVRVKVNGMDVPSKQFTITANQVILDKPLDVIGTPVEIVVTKLVTAYAEQYENLKGETGDTGSSAYEIALQNGFEGTEQEWLLSLKGNEIISDGIAEGEYLTITDAGNLPIESIMLKGKTYQETREGYNLIDLTGKLYASRNGVTTALSDDGKMILNGTPTASWTHLTNVEIDITDILEDGVTYTLSQTAYDGILYQQIKLPNNSYILSQNSKKNFTVDKSVNGKYIYIIQIGDISTFTNAYNNYEVGFMLYKGTDDKPYEQYGAMPSIDFRSEIQSVSGENEVLFNNKNLYNSSFRIPISDAVHASNGSATEENGIYTLTVTGTDARIWAIIDAGQQYSPNAGPRILVDNIDKVTVTLSNDWFNKNYVTFYDENSTSINYKAFNNKQPFSIPENAKYISFRFGRSASVAGEVQSTTVLVEYGDTSTGDYIEHQSQNYPISLGENEIFEDGYLNIEYEENLGYKNITKASVVNSYGKYVMDGTTKKFLQKHGTLYTETNGFYQFKISDKKEESSYRLFKCNYLKFYAGTANDAKDRTCIWNEYWTKYMYMSIPYTTLAEANTWLQELNTAGTPLEIVYPLETPVETEITDSTLIAQLEALINAETYKNITHVDTTNEGLKPTIKLGYNFAKGLISDEEIKQFNNELNEIEKRILLASHPIGSYYWSENSTDPSTLFGGTWERVKDKFLYAIGDTGTAGESGGSKIYTAVSHIDGQQAGLAIPSGAYSGKILITHDETVMNQKEVFPVHEKAYCWKRIT